jgi:hypothetical protein
MLERLDHGGVDRGPDRHCECLDGSVLVVRSCYPGLLSYWGCGGEGSAHAL